MPRRGSAPGGRHPSIGGSMGIGGAHGQVVYTWQGQRQLDQWQAVLEIAFDRLQQRARDYWENEEWTEDRHPDMAGEERSTGFFNVTQTDRLVVQLEFGATSSHAVYEEFGTRFREAHHPIRNTLDRVGYRVTDVIRDQARREFKNA